MIRKLRFVAKATLDTYKEYKTLKERNDEIAFAMNMAEQVFYADNVMM